MTPGQRDSLTGNLKRWAEILTIVALAMVAMGFLFRTPNDRLEELASGQVRIHTRVDSTNAAIRANMQRIDTLSRGLRVMAVKICLDAAPREGLLMGCSEWGVAK